MSIEFWFPIGIIYSQSLTVVSHWVSGFEPDAYLSLSSFFSFLEEAFFLLYLTIYTRLHIHLKAVETSAKTMLMFWLDSCCALTSGCLWCSHGAELKAMLSSSLAWYIIWNMCSSRCKEIKRANLSGIAAQLKARLIRICLSARLSCPISSLLLKLPLCLFTYALTKASWQM